MFKIRPYSISSNANLPNLVEISGKGDKVPLRKNWWSRFCTLPETFENFICQIYNFELRTDDVFVIGLTRTGTSWLEEAVWLIQNDLNFEKVKSENSMECSVLIESSAINKKVTPKTSLELAYRLNSPRLLKTHLPSNLLPQQIWEGKQKIIYIARNPKDTLVSSYYFYNELGLYIGTIDQFVDDFIQNNLWYLPYWEHVIEYWHLRSETNVLFITYEDMHRDLSKVLHKIADFLEKPKLTEEQLSELLNHLSFKNMKVNVNPTNRLKQYHSKASKTFEHMRRGMVGIYKEELSNAQEEKIDNWTKKSLEGQNITAEEIFGHF